jgi:hypothetical protein
VIAPALLAPVLVVALSGVAPPGGAVDPSTYDLRAGAWDRSVELERDGQVAEARVLLEQAYGAQPSGYEVTVRLAWLSLRLDDAERAVPLYRRARTLEGAGPEATEGLASALTLRGYQALSRGERSEARASFSDALALRPGDEDATRGLDLAREQRLAPGLWVGYLGERLGDFDASGWIAFARIPYRATDHLALLGAYRHNELTLSVPTTTSTMRMGAMGQDGRTQQPWRQDEIYLGAGVGTASVWVDALGILIASTSEGVVGGEALRVRVGQRYGVVVEHAALRRDEGWNVQGSPLLFWEPSPALGLAAGARMTRDEAGTIGSGRAELRLSLAPVDVFVGGHVGRDRWPVSPVTPMVITVDADLTAGGSLLTLVALHPSWSIGLSGWLERLEQAGTAGIYGIAALGLRWSPRL